MSIPSPQPVILVSDDEPGVLRFLEVLLSQCGMVVRTAASGVDAVEVYQREHGDIDAVLLDVQMPEMDGPTTFQCLRRISPDVRCIFMTGFIGDYTPEQLVEMGACGILQKPFGQIGDVVALLRNVVARHPE